MRRRVLRDLRVEGGGRGCVQEQAHQEQMDEGGDVGQNQPHGEGDAVGLIHVFDVAPVDFRQRGRQADQRPHRDGERCHGLDQRVPALRQNGGEDPAHDREEEERDGVAGDQHGPAAQVQPPLQGGSVEKSVHCYSPFVIRTKCRSNEPRSTCMSLMAAFFSRQARRIAGSSFSMSSTSNSSSPRFVLIRTL